MLNKLLTPLIRMLAPCVGRGWGDTRIGQWAFPFFWKLFGDNRDVETLEGITINLKEAGPFMSAILASTKTYEPLETRLFKSCLREGMIIADVGASLGWYSLVASKIVGNKGKIYAFEPLPSSYANLLRNIELNSYTNIVPINKAVSDGCGTAKLYLGWNNVERSSFAKVSRNFLEVETTRLDSYSDRFDVVRMDIEGAEPLALKGMKNLPKVMFLEFQPKRLKDLGFSPEEYLIHLREYYNVSVIHRRAKCVEGIAQYQQIEKSLIECNANLMCVREETK